MLYANRIIYIIAVTYIIFKVQNKNIVNKVLSKKSIILFLYEYIKYTNTFYASTGVKKTKNL